LQQQVIQTRAIIGPIEDSLV